MKTHLLWLVACLCLVAGCKKDVEELSSRQQEASSRTAAGSSSFNMCSNDPFPPAGWRPYSDDSPFNTLISAQAQTDPNSAEIIAWMLSKGQHPENVVFRADGRTGEPTYWAKPNDPEYIMECLFCAAWQSPLSFDKGIIRIPYGAMVEKDEASTPRSATDYLDQPDAHLSIISPDGMEYTFWGGRRGVPIDPPGKGIRPRKLDDVFSFSFAGRTPINGNGLSQEGKGNAAAFGGSAGRIRAEELLSGRINHALALVVAGVSPVPRPITGKNNNALVSPDPNAPALGSRIHLDMTFEEVEALANYGVPRWQLIIFHALREYGGIISDTGVEGYFALEFESGSQYKPYQLPDRFVEFAKNNGFTYKAEGEQSDYPPAHYVGWWGAADGSLDYREKIWSRLRVLAE